VRLLTVLRAPYARDHLTAGIVHIGVGGFHRSHQARYVDELLREGKARDWAIVGVAVLPEDARMRDALQEHDGLYTLVVKHPDGSLERRVIGSILEMLLVSEGVETVLERLAAPTTRIVSLTVTEGGYAGPQAWFGLVTESLARRRARGIPPYTVMSCDNVPGNGEVARRALLDFSGDEDLLEGVRFPSSMVDRITPATTTADRELAEDAWPVVCEPWTQWVLEDDFGIDRPPFEDAGVQLVEDVEPYELMKLRLLNGSHQAMAYLGVLAGYEHVHEVCADPAFIRFLQGFMDEVTPTLRPVPGIDLDSYKLSLLQRFANPAICDRLDRLCAETSARIPPWLGPVIRGQLAAGRPVDHLARVVASWARHAEVAEIVDQQRERVLAAVAEDRFLAELLPDVAVRFKPAFDTALSELRERELR
jgi:mannitol 2-dehydrogenase